MKDVAAAVSRIANRQMDNVVRKAILNGSPLEPGNPIIHPLWTTTMDTGFYRQMVAAVDGLLRDQVPGTDGEDILMGIFADESKLLETVGLHMGRGNGGAAFSMPPAAMLKAPQQLWKFLARRVRDLVQTADRRKMLLQKEVTNPHTPEFWEFLEWVLSNRTPLTAMLEADLRAAAGKSGLAHEIISRMKRGEPLKALSALAEDLGFTATGGGVRTVKTVFIPAVQRLVAENPTYMEVYETWAGV